MSDVNNDVPLSSAHISGGRNYEVNGTEGNRESTPLTEAVISVHNSNHERYKENSSGGISARFNLALQWLGTSQFSVGNGSDKEGTELQAILTDGENLHRQADLLRASETQETVPHAWKGSIMQRCLVGLGLIGTVGYAGYRSYNARTSTGSQQSTPQPSNTSLDIVTTGGSHGGNLGDSFGHHALHHDDPVNRTRHGRRHLPLNTLTPSPDSAQAPIIVKNDYSCIDERQKLSSSDMLRVISKTLKSPFKESGKEWHIFYNTYILGEGCPDKSKLHLYEDIYYGFDYIAKSIMNLFPQFIPVRVAQNLISPILEMISDQLDGKEINLDDIEDINLEILSMTQMISSSLDLNAKEKLFSKVGNKKNIADILELKKGYALIKLQGGDDKYRLFLDSKGTYVHVINRNTLECNRQYVEYKGKLDRWELAEQPKVIDFNLPILGQEKKVNIKEQLLSAVRQAVREKYSSSRAFIGNVLTKSGVMDKESFNKVMQSEIEGLPWPEYMDDINKISTSSQLKNIKAGNVIFFHLVEMKWIIK